MTACLRPLMLLFLLGASANAHATELAEIDWLKLLPPADLKAMQDAPPVDHNAPGAPTGFQFSGTVPEMDGQSGRIAGYVVPIETDAEGKLAEFFLVPYFGACIHLPAPPPNQIIHVALPEPIEMTDIYAPYWVAGTVKIQRHNHELGASAYAMTGVTVSRWE
jgi:uncharacterized protein